MQNDQDSELTELLRLAIFPSDTVPKEEISHRRYVFEYVNNRLVKGHRVFDEEDFENAEEILEIFRKKGWKIETEQVPIDGLRSNPSIVTQYVFSSQEEGNFAKNIEILGESSYWGD